MSENVPMTETEIRRLAKTIDAVCSDVAYRVAGMEVPDADDANRDDK